MMDGPQGQPKEHLTTTSGTYKHTGNEDTKICITQQIIVYSGETMTPMKKDQDQVQTEWYGRENTCPLNMYEGHNQNEDQRPIQICQQNVNKSLISQLDLLQSLWHNDYDVCTIQEPYIDHKGKTRANQQWITVYPNTHHKCPDKIRSVILINTNLSTDTWKQLQF